MRPIPQRPDHQQSTQGEMYMKQYGEHISPCLHVQVMTEMT